jgi:hypothetical protein
MSRSDICGRVSHQRSLDPHIMHVMYHVVRSEVLRCAADRNTNASAQHPHCECGEPNGPVSLSVADKHSMS